MWVPAGVVAGPKLQVSGRSQWIQNMVLVVFIKGVGEILGLTERNEMSDSQNRSLRSQTFLCGEGYLLM